MTFAWPWHILEIFVFLGYNPFFGPWTYVSARLPTQSPWSWFLKLTPWNLAELKDWPSQKKSHHFSAVSLRECKFGLRFSLLRIFCLVSFQAFFCWLSGVREWWPLVRVITLVQGKSHSNVRFGWLGRRVAEGELGRTDASRPLATGATGFAIFHGQFEQL